MEIVLWVQTNWLEIVKVIAYIIAAASVIVKFTPTPKDDAFLAKIVAFLSKWIALNK
jgi:hypothetical protein